MAVQSRAGYTAEKEDSERASKRGAKSQQKETEQRRGRTGK